MLDILGIFLLYFTLCTIKFEIHVLFLFFEKVPWLPFFHIKLTQNKIYSDLFIDKINYAPQEPT